MPGLSDSRMARLRWESRSLEAGVAPLAIGSTAPGVVLQRAEGSAGNCQRLHRTETGDVFAVVVGQLELDRHSAVERHGHVGVERSQETAEFVLHAMRQGAQAKQECAVAAISRLNDVVARSKVWYGQGGYAAGIQ
jgi:hypothetical protein